MRCVVDVISHKDKTVVAQAMPSPQIQLPYFQKKLIGTKTTSSPCHRLRWPSLYSFEGQMTKRAKRSQSCSTQKWTFLGKIWSKNDQSFCNMHNVVIQEKLHIPGGVEKAFLVPQESWRESSW
jgi:hypothetical protein